MSMSQHVSVNESNFSKLESSFSELSMEDLYSSEGSNKSMSESKQNDMRAPISCPPFKLRRKNDGGPREKMRAIYSPEAIYSLYVKALRDLEFSYSYITTLNAEFKRLVLKSNFMRFPNLFQRHGQIYYIPFWKGRIYISHKTQPSDEVESFFYENNQIKQEFISLEKFATIEQEMINKATRLDQLSCESSSHHSSNKGLVSSPSIAVFNPETKAFPCDEAESISPYLRGLNAALVRKF